MMRTKTLSAVGLIIAVLVSGCDAKASASEVREWVIGLAQTFAAVAAAVAAFWAGFVAKRVAAFQYALSSPRLYVLNGIKPGHDSRGANGLEWSVELRNDGLSAATLVSFSILTDGVAIPARGLEDIWRKAFLAIGLGSLSDLSVSVMRPPITVPAGKSIPLFRGVVRDPQEVAVQAMRRLRIVIEWKSGLEKGEKPSPLIYDFGSAVES